MKSQNVLLYNVHYNVVMHLLLKYDIVFYSQTLGSK